ncbi:MAG: hypothetical protein LBC53_05285, partial [Spirochaetaceae bacterium]|nr:hypothetical protein [Spirochaetaceae bacterium]
SSIAETACWEENAREAAAEQDDRALQDPAPASLPLIQAPKARNRPERLKLLVLCLKSSPPPSDDLLSKAAAAAGISQNSLRSLLLQIKLARKKEEDALANLSCKLRSRFLKTLQAEKNCALNSNPDKKNALLAEALKRKRTLLNMRERLKKKRAAPSNRQIALVLKIPKGTVDTYVYSLRKLSAAPNTPAGLNILDVNTNSTT